MPACVIAGVVIVGDIDIGGIDRRGRRLDRLRQAEVEHLDGAVGTHLDVGRLEVSMHDADVVRRFERVGGLPRDLKGFIGRERALPNAIREGRPFDELHDQRDSAVGFLEAVDGGDVWVIQRRQDLGFAAETRQPIGIRGHQRGKNLDRDSTLQPAVGCLVDLAHSAGADLANHFVGAEAGTCIKHEAPRVYASLKKGTPRRDTLDSRSLPCPA